MDMKRPKPRIAAKTKPSEEGMNRVVAEARRAQHDRMAGYRERSLKIHPWVCAKCSREFTTKNLRLLTVHHKDHNHDNNPPDGSNWENLCVYCHENEHSRYADYVSGEGAVAGDKPPEPVTHKPFAALADLLKKDGG